ncbi:transaldolase [Lipingzhangella sp. LS1_29]|uniref:Transaldolase n=1 Tax=Lipingzhangella rawalii TaxID=2055835 RepID=A0ABU2H0B7_9ACTN|nr:transaldolase [Lipingzhangella rawalii]MDS1268754.1 transaldolase [Lipingzhangella rawalii]
MTNPLTELSQAGVAVWLDDISRGRLDSGNLDELITKHEVVGVTSNPTIFAGALASDESYSAQLADLRMRGVGVEEAVRAITSYDIRWAADVLRPVYERTDSRDGRVSLEVDPRLAHDTERTLAEARALWWLVDRPNTMIKIPATVEGLPAIAQALAEGISVNVTLIFSLDRYRAVLDAFLEGMEQARAAGRDLSGIGSVASFFVSRVDSEVDRRLAEVGSEAATSLRGRAAIANARLAYAEFEHVLASERWRSLAADGAQPQRPLWASTGVKDPAFDDTRYVTELVAPSSVNTMPEATLHATADHGKIRGDTIRGTYEQARADLDALAEVGVDYDDVVRVLEEQGVQKFEQSWTELLASVADALSVRR